MLKIKFREKEDIFYKGLFNYLGRSITRKNASELLILATLIDSCAYSSGTCLIKKVKTLQDEWCP